MVATILGSISVISGLSVISAILYCCCRRRRVPDSVKSKEGNGHRKSPSSPPSSTGVQETTFLSESISQEGLVVPTGPNSDSEMLINESEFRDFSMVQRETSILKSFQKPPPPKNRAKSSRVVRDSQSNFEDTQCDISQKIIQADNSQTVPYSKLLAGTPVNEMNSSKLTEPSTTRHNTHLVKEAKYRDMKNAHEMPDITVIDEVMLKPTNEKLPPDEEIR